MEHILLDHTSPQVSQLPGPGYLHLLNCYTLFDSLPDILANNCEDLVSIVISQYM